MQFTKSYKEAIVAGDLTHSIRTWKSPRAKVGGQYNIDPYGAIEVTAIQQMPFAEISNRTLTAAGYANQEAALEFLGITAATSVYVVSFRYLGATRVNQVGTTALATAELKALSARLNRMDSQQPWVKQTLRLIEEHPEIRAGDLAPHLKMDTPTFKRQVRKLKNLGLTLSLEVGYKLSPRGKQMLKHMDDKP